jgi:hypothetical protein
MKWLVILSLFLSGCGGKFWLTPVGHRAFYKSANGQLSCYGTSCCYPYKEKLMICTESDGVDGATIVVKYVPDK